MGQELLEVKGKGQPYEVLKPNQISEPTYVNGEASIFLYVRLDLSTADKVMITFENQNYVVENVQYKYVEKQNAIVIDSVVLRGFRKDGKPRERLTYIYRHSIAPIIPQLPTNYHDLAKVKFVEEMADLETQLTTLKKKGLVI